MKENVERKIEIHFTGECQQESFSRFSSDNVTSHLSTQKKILHTEHSMKKLTKKEKSIISMYFIEPKKKRKKGKKLYVYEKREEKQKK